MHKTDKKMAAAMAAVNCYLQEEEAAAQAMAEQAASVAVAGQFLNQASQWTLATRLDMMSSNCMLQMRAFSRTR